MKQVTTQKKKQKSNGLIADSLRQSMTDKLKLMGMGKRAQIASTRKNKRYFHNSFMKSKCIIQNYELHATKKKSHIKWINSLKNKPKKKQVT